jgi:neutral ceramidase
MRRAAVLLALAFTVALPGAAAHGSVRAGAAAADLTPPVGTPQFAYTARSYVFDPGPQLGERVVQLVDDPDTALFAKTFEPSVGIHTRVYARALVLEQDGQKYAMAMADLGGLPYALTQLVLEKIADTGIDGEHLMISATHTHSSTGPIWPLDNSGYGFVGGDAFDPRLFELTAESIAEAIRGANDRLAPAKVGVGTTIVRDASRNREYEVYLRNKDLPETDEGKRDASIDPVMSVVRVDGTDGKPIAAWSNFAIHGTSFGDYNHLISGDNMSFSARLAEREIAARGGGPVVNVWTNGAEGDVSPNGGNEQVAGQDRFYNEGGDSAQVAHLAGIRTARGIVRAWEEAGKHMSTTPLLAARRTLLDFDGSEHGATADSAEPVGPFPVLGLGVVQEYQCAPVEGMAGPGQGMKMPLVGGPGLAPSTVPVSFWTIDRLGVVGLPVEMTTTMARRIQDTVLHASAGALDRVSIAGLTNAYLSYTATPEEYDACSYEGSFTLFGRQMGYALLDTAVALQSALQRGEEMPGAAEPPQLGFGTTQSTPARVTSDAGTVVTQPQSTTRYGSLTFAWQGGDPQVDMPRGETFVALQHKTASGWRTIDTDDSFGDTVTRAKGDVWTETYQLDGCAPTGTYRFHVTGRAVTATGAPASDYTVDSAEFEVAPLKIDAGTPTVVGDSLEIRPTYPAPATGLLALPRLVEDARIKFDNGPEIPGPDADGIFRAPAQFAGHAFTVTDGCGNASA